MGMGVPMNMAMMPFLQMAMQGQPTQSPSMPQQQQPQAQAQSIDWNMLAGMCHAMANTQQQPQQPMQQWQNVANGFVASSSASSMSASASGSGGLHNGNAHATEISQEEERLLVRVLQKAHEKGWSPLRGIAKFTKVRARLGVCVRW